METPGYSMNYGSAEDKETAKKTSVITNAVVTSAVVAGVIAFLVGVSVSSKTSVSDCAANTTTSLLSTPNTVEVEAACAAYSGSSHFLRDATVQNGEEGESYDEGESSKGVSDVADFVPTFVNISQCEELNITCASSLADALVFEHFRGIRPDYLMGSLISTVALNAVTNSAAFQSLARRSVRSAGPRGWPRRFHSTLSSSWASQVAPPLTYLPATSCEAASSRLTADCPCSTCSP